ncbi:hypothetical protein CAEBREN_17939 [Caenorhabditis brenneri]|uniref:Uncharacterized protein n=1 Tax=Caenorhabditis brenneri TaxID=135651 RepID=G0PB70_CAEBE|nr:hypothetical protein CAEBREN_17939 [Caenorhabditis brenneri]
MFAARITVDAAPIFIEVASLASLAQRALVSSKTDQVTSLTLQLQEAKEAHKKFAERKDQEILALQASQAAAQKTIADQARAIQGLTGILQAKQANLDEAQGSLKGLRSQLTGKMEQVEMLQDQLQSSEAKCAYYQAESEAQQAMIRQSAATIGRQNLQLAELRACQAAQTRETLMAEKALLDAELHAEVELQESFQAQERLMEDVEKLQVLRALCEERGDAAEQELWELNEEIRQKQVRKVARRINFGEVKGKKPVEAPAEPPLEKMPNFLQDH